MPIVTPLPQTDTSVDRIYFVKVSFVDSLDNESAASDQSARQFIPGGSLARVKAPQPSVLQGTSGIRYDRYNVYAGTVENQEVLQTTEPLSIAVNWNEPEEGLLLDTCAAPTDSAIEPLRGYVLDFQYYRQRAPIVSTGQPLQISADYQDIVVAGVNHYVAQYLKRPEEAQIWMSLYRDGLRQIVKDYNLFPGGESFIKPDPTANSSFPYFLPSFDGR